jgi:hypothetical protein
MSNRYGYLAPYKMTETDCLQRAVHYESMAYATEREDFAEAAAAYYHMAQDARRLGTVVASTFRDYLSAVRFNYQRFTSPCGFVHGAGA